MHVLQHEVVLYYLNWRVGWLILNMSYKSGRFSFLKNTIFGACFSSLWPHRNLCRSISTVKHHAIRQCQQGKLDPVACSLSQCTPWPWNAYRPACCTNDSTETSAEFTWPSSTMLYKHPPIPFIIFLYSIFWLVLSLLDQRRITVLSHTVF